MWINLGGHFSAHHTSIAFPAYCHLHIPLSLFQFSYPIPGQHTLRTVITQNCSTLQGWPQPPPFSASPLLLPHLHSGCWNPQFPPNLLTPSGFSSSFLPSLDAPADWTLNFSLSITPDYLPPFRRLLQKILKPGLTWLGTCLASILGLQGPPGR